MAGTTAVARQTIRVTGPAVPTGAFVIHIEGVPPVVPCRQPAAGAVAGCTVGPQDTGMVARLSVAGRAVRGRALVDPVPMTRCTADPGMGAREREASLTVVQRSSLPATGRVALRAGLTELPVVFVACLVTGSAVLGGSRVPIAWVTLHAGNLPVPPCERVWGRVVIKAGSLPAVGRVALPTGLTELPTVLVFRLVTGRAVLRSSRVLAARMA